MKNGDVMVILARSDCISTVFVNAEVFSLLKLYKNFTSNEILKVIFMKYSFKNTVSKKFQKSVKSQLPSSAEFIEALLIWQLASYSTKDVYSVGDYR